MNTQRIFKIGTVRIVEDETMRELSLEQVKDLLKSSYPEVTHATTRETVGDDGTTLIEFLPQPGRKG
jgi:hypothetical protein